MDEYRNQNEQPQETGAQQAPPVVWGRGFATASLVFGILALLSTFTMTVALPVFFGSMAVILGILSRGKQTIWPNNALAGVIVGVCTVVINIALGVGSVYLFFSNTDLQAQYWDMVNESYEQITGMTLDEFLESYGLDADMLPGR